MSTIAGAPDYWFAAAARVRGCELPDGPSASANQEFEMDLRVPLLAAQAQPPQAQPETLLHYLNFRVVAPKIDERSI